MTTNDTQLRERFVMAIDEAVPPAPWLESRVTEAIQRVPRRRQRGFGLDRVFDFRPGLRMAAGLAAVLIGIAAVAALMMSARLHAPTVPVRPGPTVTSPSASQAEVPWNPTSIICATFWFRGSDRARRAIRLGMSVPGSPPAGRARSRG